MASTAADILVETLIDWGVDTVFGLPGDGINGIMEALRKRRTTIRFVQVRHEEAAAFMACAYAKYTGRLGVCLATSGPGGIHLLNGLYDAKLDGQPVLAITGLQFHDLMHTSRSRTSSSTSCSWTCAVYNARVMGPAHVENVVELACRTALAYRGVAHITIPVDIQSKGLAKDGRSQRNVPEPRLGLTWPRAPMCRHRRPDATGRRRAQRRQEGLHPGRAAARSARRANWRSRRAPAAPDRQGAARQGVVAGRQPLHDRRHRAARHAAVAGGAGELRHAADRRQLVPLHRVLSRARARHAASRSTSIPSASACAIRSRSAWSAIRPRVLRTLLPRSTQGGPLVPGEGAGRHEGVARADAGARHPDRTSR